MSELMRDIDERTRLAGANKLELLLFTLGKDINSGREEIYGINVFKVREVLHAPPITRAPEMPAAVEGMVSLRGVLVPIIDIARYTGIQTDRESNILIVTEYNGRVQGFLVADVDKILRLEWSNVKVPPEMMMAAQQGGLVTAVTELPDGRLVMILDVERVLSETSPNAEEQHLIDSIKPLPIQDRAIFFADDSSVARSQVGRTLERLGIKGLSASNGRQAWEMLQVLADRAMNEERPVKDFIQLILTDVEMPEIDGYSLTKKIKQDGRFKDIPVVMHSSLSGTSNQSLGKSVGVDYYVSKFDPTKLSSLLSELLLNGFKK